MFRYGRGFYRGGRGRRGSDSRRYISDRPFYPQITNGEKGFQRSERSEPSNKFRVRNNSAQPDVISNSSTSNTGSDNGNSGSAIPSLSRVFGASLDAEKLRDTIEKYYTHIERKIGRRLEENTYRLATFASVLIRKEEFSMDFDPVYIAGIHTPVTWKTFLYGGVEVNRDTIVSDDMEAERQGYNTNEPVRKGTPVVRWYPIERACGVKLDMSPVQRLVRNLKTAGYHVTLTYEGLNISVRRAGNRELQSLMSQNMIQTSSSGSIDDDQSSSGYYYGYLELLFFLFKPPPSIMRKKPPYSKMFTS